MPLAHGRRAVSGWQALELELAAWQAAGRCAGLWWRDDDAVAATPALARLLAVARRDHVPLALAVVPLLAEDGLAKAIAGAPVTPIQHGLAHANHAPAGARSAELAAGRPREDNLRDLARGRRRMAALFGANTLPVLVPPWNRIDAALLPHLPGLGFCGLSTFGARTHAFAAPGLLEVNTHLDIIDWRGGRGFVGEGKALGELTAHLRARRSGEVDADEPSGLLSHHLAHDAAAWGFLEELVARASAHPAVRWLAVREIFAGAESAAPPVAAARP